MGRKTVYNHNLTANWEQVSAVNKGFVNDYLRYCRSQDRSPMTLLQYGEWLKVFFCWNLNENGDKQFTNLKKRDFVYYFGWCRENGMSANRIASLKSVLSSLSNEIELLYEDEYPTFKNQLRGLEAIHIDTVREKTVLSMDQLKKILQALVDKKQYQVACYLSLACSCGARKAELIQIKVSDFTEDHKVFDGYMYATHELRSKGRGKKGKIIKKYVIVESFQPFLDLWMQERERLGITTEELFVTKSGGKIVPATISTANSFCSTISKIGEVPFYSHAARHFFCSYLRGLNLPDEVIRLIFSWESTELIKIYDDTPVSEKLDGFFKEFNNKNNEVKGE